MHIKNIDFETEVLEFCNESQEKQVLRKILSRKPIKRFLKKNVLKCRPIQTCILK